MNAEMRKNALRQYLVFRVKLIEFFDIGAVRQNLLRGTSLFRTPWTGSRPTSPTA